jgi:hypothetical protein
VPELTCGHPPCSGSISIKSITLAVNLSLQRVGALINFIDQDGKAFNVGTPTLAGSDGIPITISNGVLSFNQTFNLTDYPQNQGAFRCEGCATGNTVGFLTSMTISGTVTGSTANLVLAGTDSGGGGSFAVSLTQATPPNNFAAAAVIPGKPATSTPTLAVSASRWNVTLAGDGSLAAIGPGVGIGWGSGAVGSGYTINGSAPTAGDLVWGHWNPSSGAQVTDFGYNTHSPSGPVPWITGTATNTLAPSLGTLSYTPVGSFVYGNNAVGTLNSGSLTADFVNRVLSIDLKATNGPGTATFAMSGTTGVSAISGRFGAGFNSVSCTGSCGVAASSGNYSGFFAGANAEGAGVAFSAGNGVTSVIGVVGFKR